MSEISRLLVFKMLLEMSPQGIDGNDTAVILCRFEEEVEGMGGARGNDGGTELRDVGVR